MHFNIILIIFAVSLTLGVSNYLKTGKWLYDDCDKFRSSETKSWRGMFLTLTYIFVLLLGMFFVILSKEMGWFEKYRLAFVSGFFVLAALQLVFVFRSIRTKTAKTIAIFLSLVSPGFFLIYLLFGDGKESELMAAFSWLILIVIFGINRIISSLEKNNDFKNLING